MIQVLIFVFITLVLPLLIVGIIGYKPNAMKHSLYEYIPIKCQYCDGSGKIAVGMNCFECKGRGEI